MSPVFAVSYVSGTTQNNFPPLSVFEAPLCSNPRLKKGFDDAAQRRRSPLRATRRARRGAPSNPAGRTIFAK